MTSVNKILIVLVLAFFVFGVVGYVTNSNVFLASAEAAGSCGACGDSGGGSSSDDDDDDEKPARCLSFTASKDTLPYGGGNVTLTVGAQHANSASVDNGVGTIQLSGWLNKTGSKAVHVSKTTTFKATVYGDGGNHWCVVKVVVEPKPVEKPAKCDSFTADRTTVPYGGGNVKLNWNTTNATSVSISGIGNVSADGSKTVFVDSNTTFTLTAKGTGGNDDCAVTIKVDDKPDEKAAKCDYFEASRTRVPHNGGNVTLSWGTTNATSVSISGIGNVSADGSKTVFVDSNTTFTLTARGTGGNDDCAVTIKVDDKPTEDLPICNYLRIDGDSVVDKGDKVTLEWETTDADYVEITPTIGSVSPDGDISVTIKRDTTFTLIARTADGKEDTCTVKVRVDDEQREKMPRCEFDISKTHVSRGDIVTLEWETTRAERVRVRDNHGHTLFDTDDYPRSKRDKYFDGELDVRINKDTEFRLLVDGKDGDVDCEEEVEVDDLAVYEKRDQGVVIALTQVPYTGFEAGPFLTFLFYAVLTLWALFVAYILVIKKGSILGFALYKQGAAAETDSENRKKVEALVAKYSHRN